MLNNLQSTLSQCSSSDHKRGSWYYQEVPSAYTGLNMLYEFKSLPLLTCSGIERDTLWGKSITLYRQDK